MEPELEPDQEQRIIAMFREHMEPLEPLPAALPPRGPGDGEQKPVKAVLFDIYGTLFISDAGDIGTLERQQPRTERVRRLLDRYGIDRDPAGVKTAFMTEVRDTHQRLRAAGIDHPEVRYEEIWQRVLGIDDREGLKTFAAEYEVIVNPVYPMPHLARVLAEIKARGLVMGLISNAQFFTPLLFPAFLSGDLGGLGFDRDLLFYSYRCGRAKPSDHMFRLGARALGEKGIRPGEVIYLGNDMEKDVLPARRVGFRGILFAGDRRSLRTGTAGDHKADGIVDDLRQITRFLPGSRVGAGS